MKLPSTATKPPRFIAPHTTLAIAWLQGDTGPPLAVNIPERKNPLLRSRQSQDQIAHRMLSPEHIVHLLPCIRQASRSGRLKKWVEKWVAKA